MSVKMCSYSVMLHQNYLQTEITIFLYNQNIFMFLMDAGMVKISGLMIETLETV